MKKWVRGIALISILAMSLVMMFTSIAWADTVLSGPPTEVRTMLSPIFTTATGVAEATFEVTPGAGFDTNMVFCMTDFSSNSSYKPTNLSNISRTAFRFYTDDNQSYYPALFSGTSDKITENKIFMTSGTKYDFKIIIDFNNSRNSLYVKKATDSVYTAVAVDKPFYLNSFASLPAGNKVNVIFSDHTIFPWKNFRIKDTVNAPKASLASGTYNSVRNITLSCAHPNADIYYTTNGTTPNKSSLIYNPNQVISINKKTLIKAIAYVGANKRSDIMEFDYDIVYTHTGVYGQDKYVRQGVPATVHNNPIVQAKYATDDESKVFLYPLGKSYSGNVLIEFDLSMTDGYGNFHLSFGGYNHSAPSKNASNTQQMNYYKTTGANIFYRPVVGVNAQAFNARQDQTPPVWNYNSQITGTGAGYYYINRIARSLPTSRIPVKVYIDTINNRYSFWVYDFIIANDYIPTGQARDNIGVLALNSRLNDITIENLTIQNGTVEKTAPVTASVPSGTYNSPQQVSLSCATARAIIFYSVDGSAAIRYTAPLTIDQQTSLVAYAYNSGMHYDVNTFTYEFGLQQNSVTKNLVQGKEFNVVSSVSHANANTNKVFTLTYNPAKAQLVDVSYQNYSKAVTAGTYGRVQIISVTPGEIKYKLISAPQSWTGVVNIFRFKALASGEAVFNSAS